MDDIPDAEPSDLAAALVAAFPTYLRQRLDALGAIADDVVRRAIAASVAELAGSLELLASLPPEKQVKSPLELVRDATAPLTAVLSESGVNVPDRDDWAVAVHPEDTYDLYPPSSRDLGEEAWQLHLAWGIDKARVVAGMVPAVAEPTEAADPRGPTVALFGVNRDEREELIAAVRSLGYVGLVWRNPADLSTAAEVRPSLVLVDLSHSSAHDAIRMLAGEGIRVVAVTDRVNDLAVAGIMALGAEEVVGLRRIVGRMDRLLPRLA